MKIALVIGTIAALAVATHADPQTAETLYAEGQAAYDHADYTTAIAKWQAAYDASSVPDLLFNLAQAERLAGDCTRALTTYRKFITADPTSEQKSLAEDLVRELEGKCVEKPKQTPPPAIESPHVTTPYPAVGLNLVPALNGHKHRGSPGRALKIAGVSTSGASLAAIAIGVGLGLHAQTLGNEVSAACRTSCNWAQWKAKDAAGRSDAAAGRALDVGGAIGIAGAAALYYLGMRQGAITFTPMPHEGGAGLSWSRSW